VSRQTIVREDPPPGAARPDGWLGPWPPPSVVVGAFRRRPNPVRWLVRMLFAIGALLVNGFVILVLLDQLAPELSIKYQALKYFRWVPYAFSWATWWIRNRGRG
jgi:hypothetical protein